MELQVKEEEKDEMHAGKLYKKILQIKDKRCLLILDLKPFRLKIKWKVTTGREFPSPSMRGKKLLA